MSAHTAAPAKVAAATGEWSTLSQELIDAPVSDILRTAVERFAPGKLAVVSAFGPGTLVVLHQLWEIGASLPVIFIDTLHHFPETIQHVERVQRRFDLDLRVFRPATDRGTFEARYGTELWERDLERYQHVSKVEPFRRATAGLDGWVTGRRREQSATRAQLPIFEEGDRIRINPLAAWTRNDVWKFILDHDIPYNPLHDQGYASIGDEPLTSPVSADEPERAGRWRGLSRTECGIHL